jgi:hypothetical protein
VSTKLHLSEALAPYRGTKYGIKFTFKNSAGVPISQVGKTFTASVKNFRTSTDAPTNFSIDSSSAASGIIIISLSTSQTDALPAKGEWDLHVDSGSGIEDVWFDGDVIPTDKVTD